MTSNDSGMKVSNIFKWSTAESAVDEYHKFMMIHSNLQLAGDYAYLLQGPDAIDEAYPPLPGPFQPTILGNYIDMSQPNKNIYNTEDSEYKKNKLAISTLRALHRKKCGLAISVLESLFDIDSNARISIAEERMNLEALTPPTELSVIYLAQLALLKLRFAPNKPTDGALYISKLESINFADGRGFATNSNEFAQALNALAKMNSTPDRLVIQKYLSDGLKQLPNLNMHLLQLATANSSADIPAVPSWRTCLNSCEFSVTNYPSWAIPPPSGNNNSAYSVSSYCITCGRGNHCINCTFKHCICGIDLVANPNHRATDKEHDKLRADFFANKKSQGSGDSGGRGGGGGRSGNSRGGRSPGRGGRDGGRGRGGRGGRSDSDRGANHSKKGSSSSKGKEDKSNNDHKSISHTLSEVEKTVALMAKACEANLKLQTKLNKQLDTDDDRYSNALVARKKPRKDRADSESS
jgi:hypothetical protein